MLKIKKMVDQETGENVLDSNPYFSPIFCGYLLNNRCGIAPLWTSLHLGDQSNTDTQICTLPGENRMSRKSL